jgi:DNA-binding FadR family transcriptional regulator
MTNLQLPQNKPLYEQVIELIETEIIGGNFHVGDRLPTEMEWAEKYKVSRTVIREAMKALKEKGWIETHVGKGTFVVDNVSKGVGASIDAFLRMDPDGGFEYLIEVREMLEPEIAELAARRASDYQIKQLEDAINQMSNALDHQNNKELFLAGDFLFHSILAESTGNPLVLMILNPVVNLMRAQQKFHLYHVQGGSYKSQQHHLLILEAIKKKDPAAARKHMHEHIRQVRADINEQSNNEQSNP